MLKAPKKLILSFGDMDRILCRIHSHYGSANDAEEAFALGPCAVPLNRFFETVDSLMKICAFVENGKFLKDENISLSSMWKSVLTFGLEMPQISEILEKDLSFERISSSPAGGKKATVKHSILPKIGDFPSYDNAKKYFDQCSQEIDQVFQQAKKTC